MAQPGKHVLIAEDSHAIRAVFELILQRAGYQVTLAENSDQAMAVIRPSLHPLIVILNAGMTYTANGQQDTLLLTLLANPEFANTHAFIVTVGILPMDDTSELHAATQTLAPAAHIRWMMFPFRSANYLAAVKEAEGALSSRAQGQTP